MEIKAKEASLWSKLAAAVILLAGTVLVGLGVFPNLTTGNVIEVSFTLAVLFGTVDINLMLEKITGRKTGA